MYVFNLCSFKISQIVPKSRFFPNCKGPGPIPKEVKKKPVLLHDTWSHLWIVRGPCLSNIHLTCILPTDSFGDWYFSICDFYTEIEINCWKPYL